MNIVKFDHAKFSKDILKDLEGKKFFAISIIDGLFEFHVPDDMMASHVIFGCEMLKFVTLKDSIVQLDEKE